jgi:tetratricopeptide (TPR) repeat protein
MPLNFGKQEGVVGTTKLTRKEILTEDPVHEAMIRIIEFFRVQGKNIGLGAGIAFVVALGVYFGLQYLDTRSMQLQQEFTKGLDFYHAQIDAAAQDDPYAKGPQPVFRTEVAKYQAASKIFASVGSKFGASKLGVLARYYHGLCQLQLGQKQEAVRSLEAIQNNTSDRTTGYLARKVLADLYLASGNAKGAIDTLERMMSDPQCELPKEDLKVQVARVYEAQGERDQALKLLREARDQAQSGRSLLSGVIGQELSRLEAQGGAPSVPGQPLPVVPVSVK